MDDIRNSHYVRRIRQRMFLNSIKIFIARRWLGIVLFIVLLLLILFPTQAGSVLGSWFNKLATAFIEKFTLCGVCI